MQFFVVFLFLFLPVDMITHCNNATVLSWSNNAGNLKVGRGKNQKEYTWGYVCVQEAAVQGVVDRPTWEEIFSYSEANAPNTLSTQFQILSRFSTTDSIHSGTTWICVTDISSYVSLLSHRTWLIETTNSCSATFWAQTWLAAYENVPKLICFEKTASSTVQVTFNS